MRVVRIISQKRQKSSIFIYFKNLLVLGVICDIIYKNKKGVMTVNYGFIGLGNMAGAIIRGMCRSDGFSGDRIYGFNRSVGKTEALARECGLIPAESAADLVEKCEVVVLAVKPQMLDGVLGGISEKLGSGKLVITIAAGKTLDWYAARLPEGTPVIRVMPNIAAKVGYSGSAVLIRNFKRYLGMTPGQYREKMRTEQ